MWVKRPFPGDEGDRDRHGRATPGHGDGELSLARERSLLITARDGSRWIGTAWFIGPHTLMTAGHCVFLRSPEPDRHGWARSIEVIPGRNGRETPFGRVTSTVLRSVTGWTEDGEQDYDYGAIILPTDLGETTGRFGFGVYDDATLLASVGDIAGYPGDKPSGTMWYDDKRISSVGPRHPSYEIDTAGGQSGSAVYRIQNGTRTAFAIHAYGGNHGPRIVGRLRQHGQLEGMNVADGRRAADRGHGPRLERRTNRGCAAMVVPAPAAFPDIAVLTPSDGRFSLPSAGNGEHEILVVADGYDQARVSVVPRHAQPSLEVALTPAALSEHMR